MMSTEDGKPIHGEIAIVRICDWIVKEAKLGFYYPVKSEIFPTLYRETHRKLEQFKGLKCQ